MFPSKTMFTTPTAEYETAEKERRFYREVGARYGVRIVEAAHLHADEWYVLAGSKAFERFKQEIPQLSVSKFPSNVKKVRVRAGHTQVSLSRKLGVALATVRSWETGRRTPSMKESLVLAGVLESSLIELLA